MNSVKAPGSGCKTCRTTVKSTTSTTSVLAALVVLGAVAAAFFVRSYRGENPPPRAQDAAVASDSAPTFVELGSDKCTSCRAMIPVLDELRSSGCNVNVRFVDVWDDPAQGEKYGVTTIPTQVLLGPDGRELTRHTGFWSANAIRAAFASTGHPLVGAAGSCES